MIMKLFLLCVLALALVNAQDPDEVIAAALIHLAALIPLAAGHARRFLHGGCVAGHGWRSYLRADVQEGHLQEVRKMPHHVQALKRLA